MELFLAAIAAIGFVLAAALARRLVPEPWATGAALVAGLSPPALMASTTIAPDAVAATVLAGAALLALRIRERPRRRWAFGARARRRAAVARGASSAAPPSSSRSRRRAGCAAASAGWPGSSRSRS